MLVELYKHRKTIYSIYYQSFLRMLECPVEMGRERVKEGGKGVEKEVDVARSRRRAGATAADRDCTAASHQVRTGLAAHACSL